MDKEAKAKGEFFDSHCHIHEADAHYVDDSESHNRWVMAGFTEADSLIKNAHEAGVGRLICVGTTLEDSKHAVEFAQKRENVWASIGLHPHEAKDYVGAQAKLDEFAALARQPKVVAVGECGLDYFYNSSPKEDQIEILRFQMRLALQHNLPMIFHVRESLDEFWSIFDEFKELRGVLHSFTDTKAQMEAALSRGLFIGVNGIATFTKDETQREMYKAVPLDRLLLETDAPFLTPSPFRGTINEPKHVVATAEFLSGLRGEVIEKIAEQTTGNARKLFGI